MCKIYATVLLACLCSNLHAADLEELAKEGYGVLEETEVRGEFNGCEYGRRVPLTDGLVFVCDSYSYHYAYSPTVLILKNVRGGSELKILIDDEEFSGTLYR